MRSESARSAIFEYGYRLCASLPVLMLAASALLWLRYGTDLPFYDDWTGYANGDVESLKPSKLFRGANNTMSPIGYTLDALAQRWLGGNTIAYQFLSMLAVLGSLLWLQWKLLGWALADTRARAIAFAFCMPMLQPGSYWGEQNLAYHQALPLVFILAGVYQVFLGRLQRIWLGSITFILGVLAGFSYISGAFAALVAGACLLLMSFGRVFDDILVRKARVGGAGLLIAGSITTFVQLFQTRMASADDGSRHIPLAWPTQLDFWVFLLGKIGRSLGQGFAPAWVEFTLALILAAIALALCWILPLWAMRRKNTQIERVSSVYVLLFAVILIYLAMVAMGRAGFRDEAIQGPLAVFQLAYQRFHYFWMTLLLPWMVASIFVLLPREMLFLFAFKARPIGVLMAMLVLSLILWGARGVFDISTYYKQNAMARAEDIRCINRQLGSGEPIQCPGFGFLRDWTPAYNHAKKIGASFVKYFPVVKRAPSQHKLFDWSSGSDRKTVRFHDLKASEGGWYEGAVDPQILIDLPAVAPFRGCAIMDVEIAFRSDDDGVLQLFYLPQGDLEFSEQSSRLQQYPVGERGQKNVRFLVESDAGFEPKLRIDPAEGGKRFGIQDIQATCLLHRSPSLVR